MLWLMLISVVATDIAVATMFLAMRRGMATTAATPRNEAELSAELEGMVMELRTQVQQASAEIGRQRAQLRRMLTDLERQQQGNGAPLPAAQPVSRRDVMKMAAEGLSLRTIAGRTGMSLEEVRLMLAMGDDMAAAA